MSRRQRKAAMRQRLFRDLRRWRVWVRLANLLASPSRMA